MAARTWALGLKPLPVRPASKRQRCSALADASRFFARGAASREHLFDRREGFRWSCSSSGSSCASRRSVDSIFELQHYGCTTRRFLCCGRCPWVTNGVCQVLSLGVARGGSRLSAILSSSRSTSERRPAADSLKPPTDGCACIHRSSRALLCFDLSILSPP